MNHEIELSFFCDILKKCHIRTTILSPQDPFDNLIDAALSATIGTKSDRSVIQTLGNIEGNTKYVLANEFKLCYVCLRLPLLREKNLLFIGPYLSSYISSKDILEISERAGISPNFQKTINEYYATLPIVEENDRLISIIDSFCELIWQTPSFAIVEIDKQDLFPVSPLNDISKSDSFEDILANVDIMEKRYAFENELIQAVALGQQHKEQFFVSSFSDQLFEKRVSDSIRNAKNYCIIMNTLLRKAAEQGGVHPVYIDKTSSKFAQKIEQIVSIKEVSLLMKEMFVAYCRLVYKHSIKKFSPVVQKTVLIIDSDLSAELSLSYLAERQGISAGYLATVFKKETGKTVSEYVRERRIKHAMYLLNTTHLQIQTIALHCGIMDVQYFSKIFKKQIGKTPKEYRESIKH